MFKEPLMGHDQLLAQGTKLSSTYEVFMLTTTLVVSEPSLLSGRKKTLQLVMCSTLDSRIV